MISKNGRGRTRNEMLWDELLEQSLFSDREGPSYDMAWIHAQSLIDGGRLTRGDLLSLMGLIKVAVDYGKYLSDCPACNAEGTVEHLFLQGSYGGSHAESPPDFSLVACEECNGTGKASLKEPPQ